MKLNEAIEILRSHNEWRRGAEIPMTDPKALGEAIDCVVGYFADVSKSSGIEERAKKYADDYVVGDAAIIVDLIHQVAEDSYIAGATEQKKIDVEKACELHCQRCEQHNITCDGLCYDDCADMKHIRKAMED